MGGTVIAAAAPEMILAARLALAGCKSNPVLCLNQAGIYAADIAAPEAAVGTGSLLAGSTILVGKSQEEAVQFGRQVVAASGNLLKDGKANQGKLGEFIAAKGVAKNNNFDRFKKDDLVSSANKLINEQGLSAAARAWEKHAGRPGGVFEPLKGNPVQKSEAANQFVNEVLNNKGTVKTDLSRGGVEYRLPNGKGGRYNSDGSFSGFLDPQNPR